MEIIPLGIGLSSLYSVSSSAQGIYSLTCNIYSFSSYLNIITTIKELDIEASIYLLEIMIKEIKLKNTDTLNKCIELLKTTMKEIENELCEIHQKLTYNESIYYFSYLRKYNFWENHIKKLKILKKQFDNRKDLLFNIIKSSNNLIHKNNNLDVSMIE